jgi:ParB-like chromosome segregation protein Spo0J
MDSNRDAVDAMTDIKFHRFADIFPMMDEAALAELAADIKAESQREPIHLWQDQIIDGRNRYRACQIAGVEPVIKRIEFPGGEAEALAYVVSRNLKRRHLNAPQRTEAIRRLRALPKWRDISNREIARQIGVDEATVRRAGLSAAHDADAPQPASHTIAVKRGEQEYRMRVEAKPFGWQHKKDRERVNRQAEKRETAVRDAAAIGDAGVVSDALAWFDKLPSARRLRFIRALMDKLTDAERKEFDASLSEFARPT